MSSLDNAISRLNQPIKQVNVNIVKTPELTCIITGRSRFTNRGYLEQKAQCAPGQTLEEQIHNFQNHYVCKDAVKLLRQGKTVGEVRSALGSTIDTPIPVDSIDLLLNMNGSRGRK